MHNGKMHSLFRVKRNAPGSGGLALLTNAHGVTLGPHPPLPNDTHWPPSYFACKQLRQTTNQFNHPQPIQHPPSRL